MLKKASELKRAHSKSSVETKKKKKKKKMVLSSFVLIQGRIYPGYVFSSDIHFRIVHYICKPQKFACWCICVMFPKVLLHFKSVPENRAWPTETVLRGTL